MCQMTSTGFLGEGAERSPMCETRLCSYSAAKSQLIHLAPAADEALAFPLTGLARPWRKSRKRGGGAATKRAQLGHFRQQGARPLPRHPPARFTLKARRRFIGIGSLLHARARAAGVRMAFTNVNRSMAIHSNPGIRCNKERQMSARKNPRADLSDP
jgi:hypothetical protein